VLEAKSQSASAESTLQRTYEDMRYFGGDESLSINKTTDGWIYSLTPHLLMTEDFSPVTCHGEPVFLLRDG
jgi:hypothetical protein